MTSKPTDGRGFLREFDWETHQGDVGERTASLARTEFFTAAMRTGDEDYPDDPRWKTIRELGRQQLKLKADPDFQRDPTRGFVDEEDSDESDGYKSDQEWNTKEWSATEIKESVEVLFDEALETSNATRVNVVAALLRKLRKRHEVALNQISSHLWKTIEEATRYPLVDHRAPNKNSAQLAVALSVDFAERLSRVNTTAKAMRCLMFEYDLCARRVQNAWRHHAARTFDRWRLVGRMHANRMITLQLTTHTLRCRWKQMKAAHNAGILRADFLHQLLALVATQVRQHASPYFKKDRLKLVQSGALFAIVQLMTHSHIGVRTAAMNIILSLAREPRLRATLLIHDVQGTLLTLLQAPGRTQQEAKDAYYGVDDAEESAAVGEPADEGASGDAEQGEEGVAQDSKVEGSPEQSVSVETAAGEQADDPIAAALRRRARRLSKSNPELDEIMSSAAAAADQQALAQYKAVKQQMQREQMRHGRPLGDAALADNPQQGLPAEDEAQPAAVGPGGEGGRTAGVDMQGHQAGESEGVARFQRGDGSEAVAGSSQGQGAANEAQNDAADDGTYGRYPAGTEAEDEVLSDDEDGEGLGIKDNEYAELYQDDRLRALDILDLLARGPQATETDVAEGAEVKPQGYHDPVGYSATEGDEGDGGDGSNSRSRMGSTASGAGGGDGEDGDMEDTGWWSDDPDAAPDADIASEAERSALTERSEEPYFGFLVDPAVGPSTRTGEDQVNLLEQRRLWLQDKRQRDKVFDCAHEHYRAIRRREFMAKLEEQEDGSVIVPGTEQDFSFGLDAAITGQDENASVPIVDGGTDSLNAPAAVSEGDMRTSTEAAAGNDVPGGREETASILDGDSAILQATGSERLDTDSVADPDPSAAADDDDEGGRPSRSRLLRRAMESSGGNAFAKAERDEEEAHETYIKHDHPTRVFKKVKAKLYTEAIALSEQIIYVDGDDYWGTLISQDTTRRLVHLLGARDQESRLGACLVLSKLAAGLLNGEVVTAVMTRQRVVASMVHTLRSPHRVLSNGVLLLLRYLISTEGGRRAALRAGLTQGLRRVADMSEYNSHPCILALHALLAFSTPEPTVPTEDAEPLSLESTTTEASLILGRRLLEVLTGPADRTAATTLAMIRLGMIPSTVRFLCGGIDLADVAQRAASTTLPVGKGIGSTAQAVHGELDRQARIAAGTLIDMSSLTDDEDEAPTRGRGVGGRRSLIQNMDALAAADRARNGESGAVGGDNEDDDEELDDAEMAERVRERRYISSLVLERLSQCDDAMRWLCVPRVLAHLLDVLRQNRLRVEEIYANEPEADTPPSENSEETILRISIQSACRTMSTLARNKVLSRARRARVSVAVLSLGAIDDLLALLSPNVEAQVIRLSQKTHAEADLRDAEQAKLKATLDAALSAGAGKDQEQRLTLDLQQARERAEAARRVAGQVEIRVRDEEDTQEAAIVLLGCLMPFRSENQEEEEEGAVKLRETKKAEMKAKGVSPDELPDDSDGSVGEAVIMGAFDPERAALGGTSGAPVDGDHSQTLKSDDAAAGVNVSMGETRKSTTQSAAATSRNSLAGTPNAFFEDAGLMLTPQGLRRARREVIAKGMPILIGLCLRTDNPMLRSTSLFTMSRFAYSEKSARFCLQLCYAPDGGMAQRAAVRQAREASNASLGGTKVVNGTILPSGYGQGKSSIRDDTFPATVTKPPTAGKALQSIDGFDYKLQATRLYVYDLLMAFFPYARPFVFKTTRTLTVNPLKPDEDGDFGFTGQSQAGTTAAKPENPTALHNLPIPLFTLIAALTRWPKFIPELCYSGVLKHCAERATLITPNPRIDRKIRGEIAYVLSRAASQNISEFGSVNELLLKQRFVNGPGIQEHIAQDANQGLPCPQGALVSVLNDLVENPIHKRGRYFALRALGNLAEDTLTVVPVLVTCNTVEVITPLLSDETIPRTHPAMLHALRVMMYIAEAPVPEYRGAVVKAGAVPALQNIGVNEIRAEGSYLPTAALLARRALDCLGPETILKHSDNIHPYDHISKTLVQPKFDMLPAPEYASVPYGDGSGDQTHSTLRLDQMPPKLGEALAGTRPMTEAEAAYVVAMQSDPATLRATLAAQGLDPAAHLDPERPLLVKTRLQPKLYSPTRNPYDERLPPYMSQIERTELGFDGQILMQSPTGRAASRGSSPPRGQRDSLPAHRGATPPIQGRGDAASFRHPLAGVSLCSGGGSAEGGGSMSSLARPSSSGSTAAAAVLSKSTSGSGSGSARKKGGRAAAGTASAIQQSYSHLFDDSAAGGQKFPTKKR